MMNFFKEETKQRETLMVSHCQEVTNEEVVVVDLVNIESHICPLLVKKTPYLWNKVQASNTQVQYMFKVSKTKAIFDFLVKEKFITFP